MSADPTSSASRNAAVAAVQKMSQYRWIVLAILFVTYTINFGDRANIGIVLPALKQEFNLTNLELGALSSFFFLGYAITQIPAGFWYGRYGCRTLVPLSALGFSVVTWLMGTASSAAHLKWLRLALGVAEGPGPVGMATTVKTWFPKKEQSFATAFFSASVMFAPVIVPPIGVWIMANHGWRWVFYLFAIPGFFMAAIWYLFVHNNPKESPYCNEKEVEYISSAVPAPEVPTSAAPGRRAARDFGWLDRLIRAKKCPTLDTNTKVFGSRNIWTVTLAYFMMTQVFIGLLTWVPSYLVNAKHFPLMTMGFVAATPWIGAVLGAITGGWISDNVLMGRRKPNMMFAALTVAIIMLVINYLPTTVTAVSIGLFLSGFLLNIGWQNFMVYPMGLTNVRTYPVAISIVNSGGNLGGFFSPMIAGWILDTYKTYDIMFMFFACCSIVGLLLLAMIDEPV